MAIKLKLVGFDQLLKDIEKASGDAEKAAENALKQSAVIMQRELVDQMKKADVSPSLISRMPQFTVENDYGKITAHVGFKKGEYNPENPSDAYKAIFLNYGTPRRSEHGIVKARGYISKAKRRAKPKIRKAQEEVLNKIFARLKK